MLNLKFTVENVNVTEGDIAVVCVEIDSPESCPYDREFVIGIVTSDETAGMSLAT